ncbi:alpha/beta hydrolase [Saccharopolyspora sp. ASAGF58]|uniref:alpha/beta hydrolase n=1 Tax=Saccharopolyspora sp. ASAGF58 TaxID=2719023 RepID=UPI00143FFB18|nr:alpha/beta hydrolase [Saccharopolyspora sp. ASAGF58]QIZ39065.1 alpha/beta hydrolase [Saccharopolyspora sp. ASAGF58]
MYLDPELAAALPALPDLHIQDLAGARARMRQMAAGVAQPDEVVMTDRAVPGVDGGSVQVRVCKPPDAAGPLPALLLLHGGGFVMGGLDAVTAQAADLCTRVPAVVVAVDYRLAPEHPYPAALQDCESALRWIAAGSGALGVDAERIGVYGMSAGGGLAAALTLLVRDRGGPPLCFQLLDAPEVDDRLDTTSMRTFDDTPLWNRADAVLSWRYYLEGCDGAVPPYAAPARASDFSGLPPAYVSVYENDPLRDEGLAYASGLLGGGVSVELHLFPGTFHRSAVVASAAVSRRQAAETLDALRRGLNTGQNTVGQCSN